jgi:transcription initiation factor TFIID subunit 5
MTDSPAPAAGPSSGGPPLSDATVLNKFVAEYLQSHGFDKVLEMFRQGIKDQDALEDKDGEGEVDGATPVGVGVSGRRGSAPGREAIFRAPGPVPIESTLKRNIPQAQAVAASTMSERITPEFEAQARYIIEQLQKKAEAQAALAGDDADIEDGQPPAGGAQESILDTSDRVEGYKRYRRWVDDGLELWKVRRRFTRRAGRGALRARCSLLTTQAELDGLSFPIFVHTFLELIHFGFNRTGKWFPYDQIICQF